MNRQFILTQEFERQWKHMGLDDENLMRLQQEILQNPQIGAVMEGTGRLRKMRYAFPYQGKSGSVRVIYVDFVVHRTVYLLYAYPKNVKDNLTQEEKNSLKATVSKLEKTLERTIGHERI